MQFTYEYPFIEWDESFKYGLKYSATTEVIVSGNYTHPVVVNNPFPNVSRFRVHIDISSNSVGVFGRQWGIYAYTAHSWEMLTTYTLPAGTPGTGEDGYSAFVDLDVVLAEKKNVRKIATVPTNRVSTGTSWKYSIDVTNVEITEDITEIQLEDTNSFDGLFAKYNKSLLKQPAEVYVDIGDNLIAAKSVFVDIEGELTPLSKMKSCKFVASQKEQAGIAVFSPIRTGVYNIDTYVRTSNSKAPFVVYDSQKRPLTSDGTFKTLSLVAGEVYYIIVIDSPYYDGFCDSTIRVYGN